MKKVLTLLFVFVATGVFHSSALAQILDPSTGDISFDVTNCQGGTSMVRLFDVTGSADLNVFSFSLTIDGNTRSFTIVVSMSCPFSLVMEWRRMTRFVLWTGQLVTSPWGNPTSPNCFKSLPCQGLP